MRWIINETLGLCRTEQLQDRCFLSRSCLGDDVLVVEVDGIGWVGSVLFQPVLVDTLGVKVHDRPQEIPNRSYMSDVYRLSIRLSVRGKTCDGYFDGVLFQCDSGSHVPGVYGTTEELARDPGGLDRLRDPPVEARAITEKVVMRVKFEIHDGVA